MAWERGLTAHLTETKHAEDFSPALLFFHQSMIMPQPEPCIRQPKANQPIAKHL